MKIRFRLILSFTLSVAGILFIFSFAVYSIFANSLTSSFNKRLNERALKYVNWLGDLENVNPRLIAQLSEKDVSKLPEEHILVFDNQDKLIFDSNPDQPVLSETADMLGQLREGEPFISKEKNRVFVGLERTFDGERLEVVATAVDVETKQELAELRLILISGFLVAVVVVGLFSNWFANRMLVPVSNIVGEMGKITVSNFGSRLKISENNDEIDQLSHAFNELLDRLQEAFEAQKAFVANASHEMRTPVTVLKSQIDVTLLKKRSPEEYQLVFRQILDEINNLSQITSNLLELANLSNDEIRQQMKPLSLSEILYMAIKVVTQKFPEFHISLELKGDDNEVDVDDIVVRADTFLLKTVFKNLIENACKYSQNRSVVIELGVAKGNASVKFIDNGMGIEPKDLPHIFVPFFRGQNARLAKGNGIGLSLSKKIVDLHSGQILVKSTLGQGSTFEVVLPIQQHKATSTLILS